MSPYYPPQSAGGSSTSAGLMGTGNFLVSWSSDPLLSNEKVLTAGANITITTAATTITIAATTGASASSGGLAGTGGFYAVWSSDPLLSNEKVITAGSSVTLHTDDTAIYINATTGASGTSEPTKGEVGFVQFNSCPVLTGLTKFYCCNGQQPMGGTTPNKLPINEVFAFPFVVTKALSVGFIGASVGSVSTTTLFRLGIYSNSGNGFLYPFQSVVTTSILTSGILGMKTNSVSVVLSDNSLYWFAICLGTAAGSIDGLNQDVYPILGIDFANGASIGEVNKGFRVANMFSNNMPSIFPTVGANTLSAGASGSTPLIGVSILGYA